MTRNISVLYVQDKIFLDERKLQPVNRISPVRNHRINKELETKNLPHKY